MMSLHLTISADGQPDKKIHIKKDRSSCEGGFFYVFFQKKNVIVKRSSFLLSAKTIVEEFLATIHISKEIINEDKRPVR